jgi:hypothetical protein
MENNNIVICPHCHEYIVIEELNCCIFRHGTYKINGTQIDPHLPKTECDRLFNNKLIFGCGKPFRIIKGENNNILKVEICDYI